MFHLLPFRTEKLSPSAPMVLRKWESRSPPFYESSVFNYTGLSPFVAIPIDCTGDLLCSPSLDTEVSAPALYVHLGHIVFLSVRLHLVKPPFFIGLNGPTERRNDARGVIVKEPRAYRGGGKATATEKYWALSILRRS